MNETTISTINELVQSNGHKAESADAMLTELTEGKVNNVSLKILNTLQSDKTKIFASCQKACCDLLLIAL